MFDLMKVENQYVDVRTKEQFLNLLTSSPYKFIHITTHGSVINGKKGERFCGLWFLDGDVKRNDLTFLEGKLSRQYYCQHCMFIWWQELFERIS